MKKTNKNIGSWIYYLLIALILALGLFFRLWQLDSIPPGLQYDEAFNGLDAIQAAQSGDYKIFYTGNYGREGLFMNLIAFSFKIFGVSVPSLLYVSAICGFIAIAGFFLLLKEFRLSRISVALGTFMLAFSFWHLNFSRISYRAIMVPMLLVWIYYFFLKGINSKSYKGAYFSVSGFLLGVGMHTYISFRVAPLVMVALAIGYLIIKKNFIKDYWQKSLVFILTFFLAALPMFAYFITHKDDLVGRSNAVSVFNSPEYSPSQAIGLSLAAHLGSFFVFGDPNQRHNHSNQPLLPPAWSILMALGFAISLKEIFSTLFSYIKNKKKGKGDFFPSQYFILSLAAQSTFWVMLIPGVMSIEGIPHSLRTIGVIPAAFLMTILPIEYATNLYMRISESSTLPYKPWRWNLMRISIAGLGIIIILSGISQVFIYFNVWAKNPKTAEAFERKVFDLGALASELPLKKHNYIVTNPDTHISDDGKDSALKTAQFRGYPKIQSYLFLQPLGRFDIECENSQILFLEADKWLVDQFKERCPNLQEEQIAPQNGLRNFWVLK